MIELLDLDARVNAPRLASVIEWVASLLPRQPERIVDLGAGTGTATIPLARRFERAQVLAVDLSERMLGHVRRAADTHRLGDRVHTAQADLDQPWHPGHHPDLVWAASSLHHIADPGRLLADVYAALPPGGLIVVTELDALHTFLPEDIGIGRPGLEARCRAALRDWNAHPDWVGPLREAGFEAAGQREFPSAVPVQDEPLVAEFARASLARMADASDSGVSDEDRAALRQLVGADGPHSVTGRDDLVARSSWTVWVASKPER